MLKHRLITGALSMALMLGAVLFLPTFYFSLALALLIAGAAWEWAGLIGLKASVSRFSYAVLVMFCLWLSKQYLPLLNVLVAACSGWLIVLTGVMRFPGWTGLWTNSGVGALAGLFVLIPPWIALVAMHGTATIGAYFVLFLMAMMWLGDSAAYFAGRRFGSRKLAPNVSPGKTWEGVAGAALAVTLYALAAGMLLFSGFTIAGFVLLCLLTLAFSIVGDLYESLYKRLARVKDSGNLLPGHGGILDRIDSLTSAAPVFLLSLIASGMLK